MHPYYAPKTQQTSSAVESKRENTIRSLKKIILCALIFMTLLLTPAAAVPSFDTQDAKIAGECKNPNAHFCKYTTINLPPNETYVLAGSNRDLKLRTAQKKQALLPQGYSGEITTTGDVFFADSPVVTGLHFTTGITGHVRLQTSPDTIRPEFCNVYNVFELSLENYPAGSETLVKYMLLLSEIEEKGYSPIDVSLCIYEDNIWQKLPTIYFMDGHDAYFESVTTSLGTFAIVSDVNTDDSGFLTARINTNSVSPATLDISPACFITHPVSYPAIV